MLKRAIYLVTFLLLIGTAHLASANRDCVVNRAYFKDESAQMSFEQAREQKYKPADVMMAEGFSNAAFWLRLQIDPSICNWADKVKRREGELIIRIQPTYLDEIQLFDPAYPRTHDRIVGDRYPWDANEYSSLNFNFVIPEGVSTRYVWLRLKTTSTTLMRVQVFNAQDISARDQTQELGFALYIGLLVIIFLWSLGIWAVDREKLVGIFVLNQLTSSIHAFIVMGYFRVFLSPYISPQGIDFFTSIVILLFAFMIALFHFKFYHQFDSKRVFNWIFITCMCLLPINLTLLLSGQVMVALNINLLGLWALSISLLFIPFFGIDWSRIQKPILSKYMLLAVYLLSNLVGWINLLPALGFFTANPFAPFAGLAYGLITGFVFLLLLQHRYRTIQEQKMLEVSQANANALAEKEKREEQGKFLSMLTHELKTPLSVLRMGFNSRESLDKFEGHIDQAIIDMNNIVERCVMADKFDGKTLNIVYEPCNIKQITADIAEVYRNRAHILITGNDQTIVNSDAHLLRTILVNLLDNAAKYGKEGEVIEVDVSLRTIGAKEYGVILVGNLPGLAGMPDPEMVFNKYYRAPRAYEKSGSGLGLYLIRNIANALRAQLDYLSDPQKVIFILRVPKNGPNE
jgi:signal transduction histidine kinase